MLNISLQDFQTLFNLHWCDWDGFAGNQCFDLAQFWNFVLGGTPFTGATADLIYNQPQTIYTQVANSPDNCPVAGDIIVWNWPHVGIVLSADANSVTVLEQNDPTNGSCQVKTYNYDGVIGWLHPNQLPQDVSQALAQCQTDRDINWNLAVALFGALGVQLDSNDKDGSKQRGVDAINALIQQHDKDNQTIISLKALQEQMAKEDKDYAQEALDAGHAKDAVLADEQSIYRALNVTNTKDALDAITALQMPHEEVVNQVQPLIEAFADAAFKKTKPQVKTFIQKIKDFFGIK